MNPVTTTDFDAAAFRHALKTRFNMDAEDAAQVAAVIEDCFWGEDEVNDEDLDKETRSLFYALEAEGILTFRRTEYKFEGAPRRAFFWRLTEEALRRTLEEDALDVSFSEEEEVAKLYGQLQDDMWNRDAVTA